MLPSRSVARLSIHTKRSFHDFIKFKTGSGGQVRIPLDNQQVIGVARTRGLRDHQEDDYSFAQLELNPEELKATLKNKHKIDWDPSSVSQEAAGQVLFVGIYDGHGGPEVSKFARENLHSLLETVKSTDIPDLFAWIKGIGGYFRRFDGGPMKPWIETGESATPMDLEARATQAFFTVDKLLAEREDLLDQGATCSVAFLQSLDAPATPFFSAKKLALTVAHCGDTRVLLMSTTGEVFAMTENHHADAHVESKRLRRMMGAAMITDSFGESRWMGALANTRCLGDMNYKKFGVTPEPEVRTKLLDGKDWAYLVLVSDGVTSVASDGEIVDLIRDAKNPKEAAKAILAYTEELASDDNATALVIPLAGWGKVTGNDKTKELRDYKRKEQSEPRTTLGLHTTEVGYLDGSGRSRRM